MEDDGDIIIFQSDNMVFVGKEGEIESIRELKDRLS